MLYLEAEIKDNLWSAAELAAVFCACGNKWVERVHAA
jgi:hypothetical protein